MEELRDKEVHIRQIELIYADGRNMPVNFQELMEEIKQRKTQAEELNSRIREKLVLKRAPVRRAGNKTNRRP